MVCVTACGLQVWTHNTAIYITTSDSWPLIVPPSLFVVRGSFPSDAMIKTFAHVQKNIIQCLYSIHITFQSCRMDISVTL